MRTKFGVPGGHGLCHPFLHRFFLGAALLLELYMVLLIFVDAAAHRARRGLPRRSARPGAPQESSSAPWGAEDSMINLCGFQKGAPPWRM